MHDHTHDHSSQGTGAERSRPALISILANSSLMLVEVLVGVGIGSSAVLSEALHCSTDIIASVTAYFSVKISSLPEDKVHPYGHGKFEDLAALFEAALMLVAASGALWEACKDFITGSSLHSAHWGILTMLLSLVVNYAVSRHLFQKADEFDSPALRADAWHDFSDVLSSSAVLISLALAWLTGNTLFDPVAALLVGAYTGTAALRIGRQALENLMDVSLPPEDQRVLEDVMARFVAGSVTYHGLRTRKAGAERHIDLHLVVDRAKPTGEAHDLCHEIEAAIRALLPQARVLIHLETLSGRDVLPPEPTLVRGPMEPDVTGALVPVVPGKPAPPLRARRSS